MGNPNTFTGNKFAAWGNYSFENFISITSNIIINGIGKISDIWIVPAITEKKFQQTDFTTILNSNLYSQSQIEQKSIVNINNLDLGGTYVIGSELLQYGYYKVFVKIDGVIYWDNLYFFPNIPTSEDYQTFNNWWSN